ncbi:DDRGK domain-containing protein 1 [Phytophthora boehmeriae]|uniref:DDRGK domain-containing protein 1 n=1 Tax=Phytophthora boehmeriae TaxID=109152 RepID=A0A8T1WZR4_9STRA|nr:DDRGK domain-containing protein 1 [Phytophthora boehmeriae]
MPSDGVLLVVSLLGLLGTVLLVLFFAGFFTGSKKVADEQAQDQAEVVRGGDRRAAGGLAALRKRKDKKKRNAEREEAAAPADAAAPDQNEQVEAADQEAVEPRAMTKKELQKELKRQEREELRRFDQQQREERQRLADEKEAAYLKKREEEDKAEKALEEEERKLKEEKERKEKEEFDQWKDMFTIEEQGSKLSEDSEESQMLLQKFVDFIVSQKVVLLEDLAAEFNLTTQDAIDRVGALQESNRITGIVDDRGKFIYITEEEMDKVAKFIQRRGRLGFAELSKECNKLIRLDGEADKNATSSLDWLNSEEQPEGDVADLSS